MSSIVENIENLINSNDNLTTLKNLIDYEFHKINDKFNTVEIRYIILEIGYIKYEFSYKGRNISQTYEYKNLKLIRKEKCKSLLS